MATLRNAITLPSGWSLIDLDLSDDGQVIALARSNYGTGQYAVDVYAWNGSAWATRAQFGPWSFSAAAFTVALNGDGTVLALGHPYLNDGYPSWLTWSGRIDTYDWTGSAYSQRASIRGGGVRDCGGIGVGSDIGRNSISLSPDGSCLVDARSLGATGCTPRLTLYEWSGAAWGIVQEITGLGSPTNASLRSPTSLTVHAGYMEGPANIRSYTRAAVGAPFTLAATLTQSDSSIYWGQDIGVAAEAPVIAAKTSAGAVRIWQQTDGVWAVRETVVGAAGKEFRLSSNAGVLICGDYSAVQTWDLPPVLPPEVPDVYDLSAPLIAQVYATETISLPLIASVGDAIVSLPLIARVAHTGTIHAPLIAVVRSPRFAVVPSPAVSLDVGTTEGPTTWNLTLPLIANVWSVNTVGGYGASVGVCPESGGLRMCPGATSCNLSAQYQIAEPGWSICTVPFYVTPRNEIETYTLTLPLLARVRPAARVVVEQAHYAALPDYQGQDYDRLIECLDAECGPLILPVQPSGSVGVPGLAAGGDVVVGSLPWIGLERSWFDVEPALTTITIQSRQVDAGSWYPIQDGCPMPWREGWSIPGAELPAPPVGFHPSDRVTLSTSERHHLRIETLRGETNIWPNGLVSVARWSTSGGYTEYTLTPRSGRYDVVGNPGFNSPLYTQENNTTVTVSGDAPADPPGETYTLELQLIAQVGSFTSTFEAVLYAQVYASGTITAPLIAQVYSNEPIVLPLIAQVLYPSFAVPGNWDVRVSLGGVDVTPRLLAETVEIEAEAGMARVAKFGLAPNGEPIDMAQSGVAAVEVDYLPPGGSEWHRLFTGKLAEQDIDLTTRALTCTATDARTPDLDAMSASEIEAITPGGLYSPAVQGADLTGASLADARVSTLAADLDRSPTGAWRLTTWTASSTPQFVLRESALVEESLSVQLMRFADVLNRVELKFDYRYPALRERWARLSWAYAACAGQFLVLGLQPFWLTSAAIRSAAETGGWQVQNLVAGPYEGQLKTASWWQRIRYAQTVTEGYSLTVNAPLSVTAHGARRVGERSASLEAQFDTSAWAAATDGPVTLPSVSVATETVTAITDQSSDGRNAADLAVSVLLRQARRDILASLRGGRVSFTLPLNPLIDLPHTVRVEAAGLVAQARVIRLRHELSGEDGRATTQVELAIYATPGGSTGADDLTPPTPPALPDPDLTGFTASLGGAIALVGDPEPDWDAPGFAVQYTLTGDPGSTTIETVRSQFAVQLPAVPDADAQPVTMPLAATYSVTVPSDDFTLTH